MAKEIKLQQQKLNELAINISATQCMPLIRSTPVLHICIITVFYFVVCCLLFFFRFFFCATLILPRGAFSVFSECK